MCIFCFNLVLQLSLDYSLSRDNSRLPLLHLSVSGARHRVIGPVFPARAVDVAQSELERDLCAVLCTSVKSSVRDKRYVSGNDHLSIWVVCRRQAKNALSVIGDGIPLIRQRLTRPISVLTHLQSQVLSIHLSRRTFATHPGQQQLINTPDPCSASCLASTLVKALMSALLTE